ncbi:hypothetical protein KI387_022971, partial [Taxus chinensis]
DDLVEEKKAINNSVVDGIGKRGHAKDNIADNGARDKCARRKGLNRKVTKGGQGTKCARTKCAVEACEIKKGIKGSVKEERRVTWRSAKERSHDRRATKRQKEKGEKTCVWDEHVDLGRTPKIKYLNALCGGGRIWASMNSQKKEMWASIDLQSKRLKSKALRGGWFKANKNLQWGRTGRGLHQRRRIATSRRWGYGGLKLTKVCNIARKVHKRVIKDWKRHKKKCGGRKHAFWMKNPGLSVPIVQTVVLQLAKSTWGGTQYPKLYFGPIFLLYSCIRYFVAVSISKMYGQLRKLELGAYCFSRKASCLFSKIATFLLLASIMLLYIAKLGSSIDLIKCMRFSDAEGISTCLMDVRKEAKIMEKLRNWISIANFYQAEVFVHDTITSFLVVIDWYSLLMLEKCLEVLNNLCASFEQRESEALLIKAINGNNLYNFVNYVYFMALFCMQLKLFCSHLIARIHRILEIIVLVIGTGSGIGPAIGKFPAQIHKYSRVRVRNSASKLLALNNDLQRIVQCTFLKFHSLLLLAAKILPVVRKQHLLLCTLLICNALAMEVCNSFLYLWCFSMSLSNMQLQSSVTEPMKTYFNKVNITSYFIALTLCFQALPIFLNSLRSDWGSILVSVSLILLFGEIVPQSICTHYGLAVGATMAPMVCGLVWIFFPIAFPISKAKLQFCVIFLFLIGLSLINTLDCIAELQARVMMHGNEAGKGGELLRHETSIISGALKLAEKTAVIAMTPISKTFSLDIDETLDSVATVNYGRFQLATLAIKSGKNLINTVRRYQAGHKDSSKW